MKVVMVEVGMRVMMDEGGRDKDYDGGDKDEGYDGGDKDEGNVEGDDGETGSERAQESPEVTTHLSWGLSTDLGDFPLFVEILICYLFKVVSCITLFRTLD